MATQAISKSNPWYGGRSPFKVSYGKLMMWIFLLSDAFTFSSLLVAYGALRYSNPSTDEYIEQEIGVDQLAAQGIPMTEDGQIDFKVGSNVIELFAPEGADHHGHTDWFVEKLVSTHIFDEAHWPSPDLVFNHFPFMHGKHLPLFFVSLMTFILIFSSVTMVLAVEAGTRKDKQAVGKWMFYTILGGLAFLGCQAWEWTMFINAGATPWANPYGPAGFAALFFLVTGFHGFHVFSGVVLNAVIWVNNRKGVYDQRGHYEMVEKVGLYWHFVDLVWVFVFTFFYLI